MDPAVKKGIKIVGICMCVIYLVLLINMLFFSDGFGRRLDGSAYNCNVYPFREIMRYLTYADLLGTRNVLLNLAGNIVGFMPFGALLPIFARGARKMWRVVLLAFEVSALVEFTQLVFQVGCFDVDDMILNTFGALLGYLVFAAGCRLWPENRR